MTARRATQSRATKETEVELTLDLGGGAVSIATGVGFFDHMLTLMATHACWGLTVHANGDLHVDPHHTVEDVGIVLGAALNGALGDKAGICRYGFAYVPMDEALVRTVVDLSGRAYCHYEAPVRAKRLGEFDTELAEDFVQAFAVNGRFAVHVDCLRGRNSHHIIEGVFKSLGRALAQATGPSGNEKIPSTKGVL